jgi:hypothetical protein
MDLDGGCFGCEGDRSRIKLVKRLTRLGLWLVPVASNSALSLSPPRPASIRGRLQTVSTTIIHCRSWYIATGPLECDYNELLGPRREALRKGRSHPASESLLMHHRAKSPSFELN